jgi:hypothetical protein
MTVEQILNQGVNKIMYNVDGAAVPFVEKYQEVFNESLSCNTCAGVLYEAYFKLKNHMAKSKNEAPEVSENQNEAKEQIYTIADGKVLDLAFSDIYTGEIFTADNITDEIAIALLEHNEVYAQWIVKK